MLWKMSSDACGGGTWEHGHQPNHSKVCLCIQHTSHNNGTGCNSTCMYNRDASQPQICRGGRHANPLFTWEVLCPVQILKQIRYASTCVYSGLTAMLLCASTCIFECTFCNVCTGLKHLVLSSQYKHFHNFVSRGLHGSLHSYSVHSSDQRSHWISPDSDHFPLNHRIIES